MTDFYKILSAAVLTVASTATMDAGANFAGPRKNVDVHAMMRSMAPNASAFAPSQRNIRAAEINTMLTAGSPASRAMTSDPNPEPGTTMGPVRNFFDLDGPNNELWYYTTTLWTKAIRYPYYTDYILTEYQFDIYDSQMEFVGSVHDKMRYQDDEVRVPGPDLGIDILPVITKNFFNNDDKYEVVVSIAVNSTTEAVNHYRSVIYQIGGEKETVSVYDPETNGEIEKEVDVPIKSYPQFFSDVLDASHDGVENYYMTFMSEIFGPDEESPQADSDSNVDTSFWDYLTASHMHLETYAKAGDNDDITKVVEFDIPYLKLQGDQENTMPLITFMQNDKPYILCPHYKDYFFEPYYSPYDESKMRDNNSLVLDLYALDGSNANKIQTTEIPAPKIDDPNVLLTYYGVGILRYNNDIAIGKFANDEKAYFYLTRFNYKAGDRTDDYCYYVYGPDGNRVRTLFENADNDITLSEVEGRNPHHLFIGLDDNGNYTYYFVDLIEGLSNKTVQIPALLYLDDDSDEGDLLLANADIVALGNGTWKYAFEMKVPTVDDYDNDVMRVAWFNADGTFDRMDYINMGSNVYYAQCYINGMALNPKLVKSDDEHEYMLLVKRGIEGASSSASQEELVVAQPQSDANPQGLTLLHLTPSEKGSLNNIGIYPGLNGGNSLCVTYVNSSNQVTADFYALPFDLSAIDDIKSDNASSVISFDGSVLRAEGLITVYSVQGSVVARGNDAVSVADFVPGAYIAVAQGKPFKFVK